MAEIVKINDEFFNGAQPTEEELKQLKERGIKSVVNLRTWEETLLSIHDSPEQEEKVAHEYDMLYAHIPVDADDPKLDKIDDFRRVFDQLPKPVFGHCKSGIRSGAFYLAYLGRANGWNARQTLAYGDEHGIKLSETYQALIHDYLRESTSRSVLWA